MLSPQQLVGMRPLRPVKINGDAGERVETSRLYTHICLLSHKWLYNIRDQTVFGDIFQFCISFVNLYDFMFMNMMVK